MKSIGLLFFAIVVSSCSAMFGSSKYTAMVVPSNLNAEVIIDGESQGIGAAAVLRNRNRDIQIELKAEGCDTYRKTYFKKLRTGTVILSAVSWGLLGLAIDFGTGAAYKPDTDYGDVEKVDLKTYQYNVDYKGCETSQGL